MSVSDFTLKKKNEIEGLTKHLDHTRTRVCSWVCQVLQGGTRAAWRWLFEEYICKYNHLYIHTYVYINVFIYILVCMYVSIYIYVYKLFFGNIGRREDLSIFLSKNLYSFCSNSSSILSSKDTHTCWCIKTSYYLGPPLRSQPSSTIQYPQETSRDSWRRPKVSHKRSLGLP